MISASLFQEMLIRTALIPAGSKCLAAVSGGSDSTAMLMLLSEVSSSLNLKIIAAHVNHNLREEAQSDAEFVKDLCARLGISLEILSEDIAELAKKTGMSLEEAGRWARYRFFNSLQKKYDIDLITTAHTADDQAETLLMRAANGTGISGLSGIRAKRDSIVRPLLGFSKRQLQEYLISKNQGWREDKTNHIPSAPRTSIRINVLPELLKINPEAVKALNRLALSAQEDEDYFRSKAEKFWKEKAQYPFSRFMPQSAPSFSRDDLNTLESPVRKRFWSLFISRACSHYNLIQEEKSFEPLESIHYGFLESFLNTGSGRKLELPNNIYAVWNNDYLCLYPKTGAQESSGASEVINISTEDIENIASGKDKKSFRLTHFNLTLEFAYAEQSFRPGTQTICLDPDKLIRAFKEGKKLNVRYRQNGDYFYPAGGRGSQKLKKYMQSEHIPQEKKDKIPIICCDGDIIWLTGMRADQRFLAKPNQKDSITVTIYEN